MTLQKLEGNEPTIQALVEAVKAWQHALDITLQKAGLSYPKWVLLQGMIQRDYVRGQPFAGAVRIDPDMAEHLLAELHRDGWIVFDANPHAAFHATPVIPPERHGRLHRVAQSIRALHSVSLSSFTAEERVALSALLKRMQAPLQEHSARLQHLERDTIQLEDAGLPQPDASVVSAIATAPVLPSREPTEARLTLQAPRTRVRHGAWVSRRC
ncbi:MarR family transcriptional regulator [Cupriavidus sp. AU9028]|uniref:MarR family transcriptional regulator n=1 Tax=Cupriavidus sp. AU9028 TaxID=2871157 RepID=UPI001C975C52|nr:MarR family transcriptional regulator [Cupriavidus sp. AU9028]MBY4896058.1 MarR family transcriptional regulator [Cupriavidus sp. AU9028]